MAITDAERAVGIAQQIADDILRDLRNRSGLSDALDGIDADIKDAMRDYWVRMIVKRISTP